MKSIQDTRFLKKISYWLVWAIIIGLLAYASHLYLEYRNRELDRRLKNLTVFK